MDSYSKKRPASAENLCTSDEGIDKSYGSIQSIQHNQKGGYNNEYMEQNIEAGGKIRPQSDEWYKQKNSGEVNSLLPPQREVFNAGHNASQLPYENSSMRSIKHITPKPSRLTTQELFKCVSYAFVNIIISVPGLYGYTAVIFNNPSFREHLNALSKLVIFSSFMHQLAFTIFSTLPFSIGTVQDAGLLFLSAMANIIANSILEDGGTIEEIISTTCVFLPLGTAVLGLVLYFMGKYRLADVMAYIPMPVVSGYLAFIGYFCVEAGVALCISRPMISLMDWKYMLDAKLFCLAVPGLLAGLILTLVSRKAKSDLTLPFVMVGIPALFYVAIYATGLGLDGARTGGWVGEVAPPVLIGDLFRLIDFELVRWDLLPKCVPTWIGMVFVVSFSSCLDIAAISMDMGEVLDANAELATVGISNIMSGLTFGFTGSYIFSQTIFMFRSGTHNRLVGIFIMVGFIMFVLMPMNLLQVAPLFFLGATLIFIGYDLLFEWLIDVRHKLLMSEYAVLLSTFFAIHLVGIDAGIFIGVIVAISSTFVAVSMTPSLTKVTKCSLAVWKPDDWKLLQNQGYHPQHPKIVTIEIKGSIFFGSSLQLLSNITKMVGLDESQEIIMDMNLLTPHSSGYLLSKKKEGIRTPLIGRKDRMKTPKIPFPPEFIVLDLSQLNNLDATASRMCFLQLAKMCAKRGILVCATGANPGIDWLLRSHDVSFKEDEEEKVKKMLQISGGTGRDDVTTDKLLPFWTLYEALEFCENIIIDRIRKMESGNRGQNSLFVPLSRLPSSRKSVSQQPKISLSRAFSHILGLNDDNSNVLNRLETINGPKFHEEVHLAKGDELFGRGTAPRAFFIVLRGVIAVVKDDTLSQTKILSGAGTVKLTSSRSFTALSSLDDEDEKLGDVKAFLRPGGIVGFVEFILDRNTLCSAVATMDTVVAKLTRNCMDRIKREDPELSNIVQSALLQYSALELANLS